MTSTIVMIDDILASEMSSLLSLQQQPMKQPRFFFFFDRSAQISVSATKAFIKIPDFPQIHPLLVSALRNHDHRTPNPLFFQTYPDGHIRGSIQACAEPIHLYPYELGQSQDTSVLRSQPR